MIFDNTQKWQPCPRPEIGDTLKWEEPLWAPPNKPRGKPDKIGDQEIIAKYIALQDTMEFQVMRVTKLSTGAAPLKVKENDIIRRKQSSIAKGNCQKLVE